MTVLAMSTPDPNAPHRRALRAWVAASSLAGFALAGVLGGLWLDRALDTTPLCLLAGSVLGIGLGMYQLIRQVGR